MLNYCIVVDLKGDSGALQCLKTGVLSGLGVGAFTTGVKVPRPGSLVINVIHKIVIKSFKKSFLLSSFLSEFNIT